MDNCRISCQVMADMKKVYDDLLIINLYIGVKMKYLLLFILLFFLESYIYYRFQIKVTPDWRQRNCHLETVLSLSISKSEGESMQKNEKTHIINEKQQ